MQELESVTLVREFLQAPDRYLRHLWPATVENLRTIRLQTPDRLEEKREGCKPSPSFADAIR